MRKFLKNLDKNHARTAIVSEGEHYSYFGMLSASYDIGYHLLAGKNDLQEARVAFMIQPSFEYVAVQWGIWRAGGVAVPLCVSYPLPSLQYVIEDTQADIVIASREFVNLLAPLVAQKTFRFIVLEDMPDDTLAFFRMPEISIDRRAMILYTSGTTNLPKGVVSTHRNIQAQVSTLVEAWQWHEDDHILCVLPLHHVHGIINVVSCALWAGATVEFLPHFTAEKVFEIFQQGKVKVFMAVPTIYFKLIAYYESLDNQRKTQITQTLSAFRLMVSGSAALPVSVLEKWQDISQHTLLERYGMTEIGMAISNPYVGERRAGYIGQPLKGVKVRLVDENNKKVKPNQAGEIQVKGDSVFLEYWNKPEATQKAFTADGWFKTGDVAVLEDGYYRILGRDSIDIIKSGGYKISALEIEEVLRTHPHISDCSVLGMPNEEWGELVVAALIVRQSIDFQELNVWLREKMPAYKVPRTYKILEELPRNAMGKVVKGELKKEF